MGQARRPSGPAYGNGRRPGGLRALANLAPGLTDPVLRKRGFVETRIVRDWTAIVGEDRAASCQPLTLKFPRGRRDGGVLELRVVSGLALEMQHRLPLLIERINGHFGWAAVERVRIRQGPLPQRQAPSRRRLRHLEPQETADVETRVARVGDPRLRASLNALGQAIRASRGR